MMQVTMSLKNTLSHIHEDYRPVESDDE